MNMTSVLLHILYLFLGIDYEAMIAEWSLVMDTP